MEINIGVFNILNSLAKHHDITDLEWSEAAGIRRPTISVLRRIVRSASKPGKDKGIKELCTLDKIIRLYNGLRIKIGSTILNEALRRGIDVETDQTVRLQLLILMLKDAEAEIKDEVEAMLKGVLNAPR